jgi:hypothetical protein
MIADNVPPLPVCLNLRIKPRTEFQGGANAPRDLHAVREGKHVCSFVIRDG